MQIAYKDIYCANSSDSCQSPHGGLRPVGKTQHGPFPSTRLRTCPEALELKETGGLQGAAPTGACNHSLSLFSKQLTMPIVTRVAE